VVLVGLSVIVVEDDVGVVAKTSQRFLSVRMGGWISMWCAVSVSVADGYGSIYLLASTASSVAS
jgi:hypothetical protein